MIFLHMYYSVLGNF